MMGLLDMGCIRLTVGKGIRCVAAGAGAVEVGRSIVAEVLERVGLSTGRVYVGALAAGLDLLEGEQAS